MLRLIFLATPLLAFALPFAAPQPSAARPLAGQTTPVEWCSGDGECGGDGGSDGGGSCDDITICVFTKLEVCDDEPKNRRAACHSACTELAVDGCASSLGADASYETRSRCEAVLAARCEFDCTRPKTLAIFDPTLGGGHPKPDDDDDDGSGEWDDCQEITATTCVHVSRD